jgi:hypothetical protein
MLDEVDRQTLLSQLEAMPAFLEAAFSMTSPADAMAPGPDDILSPVEQCWHLADLEREGYGVRIHRLREEADPFLPDFDGAAIARQRRYTSRSLAEGITAFRAARLRNIAALRPLGPDEWTRRGTQEGVGAVALCDVPAMMAEHDAGHRREIEAWQRARGAGAAQMKPNHHTGDMHRDA